MMQQRLEVEQMIQQKLDMQRAEQMIQQKLDMQRAEQMIQQKLDMQRAEQMIQQKLDMQKAFEDEQMQLKLQMMNLASNQSSSSFGRQDRTHDPFRGSRERSHGQTQRSRGHNPESQDPTQHEGSHGHEDGPGLMMMTHGMMDTIDTRIEGVEGYMNILNKNLRKLKRKVSN